MIRPNDGDNAPAETIRLLRIAELVQRLGISRRHVWRLVSIGEIPAPAHIGRLAVWPSDVIDEHIARVLGRAA